MGWTVSARGGAHRAKRDPVGHCLQGRHRCRHTRGDGPMPARTVPLTWRLLQLTRASFLPCAACGQVHRYLTRVSTVGDCMPVLFPPGMPAPGNVGVEVELFLLGPVEDEPSPGEPSRYHEVAARVH